jgi:ligand-binding SRPBCC domain-containing protein
VRGLTRVVRRSHGGEHLHVPAAPSIRHETLPGGLHRLLAEQELPLPPADVFPFFADAANLEAITPPFLRFRILTPLPVEMRAGALLDYRLRLRGVTLRWRTRITVWEPPVQFVDEQLSGPYRIWRHHHRFTATARGTLVTDDVVYAHAGGRLANRVLVAPDVERIFRYRQERLARTFPDG